MESSHQTLISLSLLLLLLSLLPFSLSFSPNASVYLACGSSTSIFLSQDFPSRTFVSDSTYTSNSNSQSVSLTTNKNSSSSNSSLYSTARVFTSSFTYQLNNLIPNSSNLLRLHFLPSSNLSSAQFDVLALNKYVLLSNFSVSDTSSPTIKEFFLWVDSDKLELHISPQPNSFAFINAIEAFTAPTDLLTASNPTKVGSTVFNGEVQNQAMEKMYRVNMGGPLVTPHNDTLWRTWLPDGKFLFNEQVSATNHTSPNTLYYNPPEGSSEEIGPKAVYDTARVTNISQDQLNSSPDSNVNVTWSFNVDSGYNYLVRMHFCDFISQTFTRDQGLTFTVYVMGDSAMAQNVQPASFTNYVAEPFYIDFVVYIGEPQKLNVSISLDKQSLITTGLLNGLEIMKMNNSALSLSGTSNPFLSGRKGGNNNNSLYIIIGSTIGAVLIISIAICVFIILRKRKSQKAEEKALETPATWFPYQGFNSTGTSSKSGDATTIGASARLNLGLLISFEQIKLATNKFDEKNLIGVGGFGKVYQGVLNDGTQVAVKRASTRSNQGFPEFRTEIEILSQIRHRHLVSLIGYCDENSEMILVYEFMEKGTLRSHLYGSGFPSLSWKQRLEICIGAAKGLHYLHTSYSCKVIHRDVKSTNILLGQDYLPKVSDFGLSKFSIGETHVTTLVKGSFGYLDPEYFKTQKLTDKSDVYSFGVTLFEVLCARPAIDQNLTRDQINLAEWALKFQKKGQLHKIIDPKLTGEINDNSLRKFGEVAEKCLQEYGMDRPAIGDVLWNLEYCLQLQEMEVRRDPHEDSGTAEVDFPSGPTMRRMPSSVVSYESRSDLQTSEVFSQLVNKEGR